MTTISYRSPLAPALGSVLVLISGCTAAPVSPLDTDPAADTDAPGPTGDTAQPADTGPPVDTATPPMLCEPADHDVASCEPATGDDFGGFGAHLERLDDRLIVTRHGNELTGEERWDSMALIIPLDGPRYIGDSHYIGDDAPGVTGTILGQLTTVLGDTTGDGVEDLITSVFEGRQANSPPIRSIAYEGPFEPWPNSFSETTDPDAVLLDDVGWDFARCDLNDDGLADICSVLGVAVAPPPFTTSSTFSDALATDRIASGVPLDGVDGLFFWRTALAELQFIPYANLPPVGQASDALATDRTSLPHTTLSMQVADLHPQSGAELVTVVSEQGNLGIVVRQIAPGVPILTQHISTEPVGGRGALAIGDFDLDGVNDVAFAGGSGRVAVISGSPDPSSDVVWWRFDDPYQPPNFPYERPDFPFGFSLLSWTDGDLLVGHPGRAGVTAKNRLVWGAIYRLTNPLLPGP